MKTSFQFCGRIKQRLTFMVIIFTVLLSGIFATVSGQSIPRLPNCSDSPLRPMVGKQYTYSVTIPSPYTTPQSFDWYVTDAPGFIAGSILNTANIIPNSKEFIDAGDGYHDTSTGTSSITIKWTGKSAINSKTKPYFLVIHYRGTNGTLCEAMNIRAYKIEPYNAFTLDLTNMSGTTDLNLDGSNLAVEHKMCAKDIASVSYDGTKMVYDYGTNELIFKVVAANFVGGWTPTVKISGLAGTQTIETIEWSATTTFAGTNLFSQNGASWTAGNKIPAPADNLTQDGEVIYIRVTIKNNDYEGIVDTPITLAINGVSDDGGEDVHFADCLADGFSNDVATQIILARPTITSSTGTPPQSFLP
jgi:hypothetical protein